MEVFKMRRLGLALALATGTSLLSFNKARADVFNVNSDATYRAALLAIAQDPADNHTINITGNFALAGPVPPIVVNAGQTVAVVGGGNTITGAGNRPFFVQSGDVTISNVSITGAAANGGDGSGGGLGAGGAIFVDSGANVTIDNVNFTNSSATGGNGGGTEIGGGGAGGNANNNSASGGGGLYGNGGTSNAVAGGGSGGGGALGNGGNVGAGLSGGGGGGGFDSTADGGNAGDDAGGGGGGVIQPGANPPAMGVGGGGGGVEGGDGGNAGAAGQNGQAFGGGGGGAGSGQNGGDGVFGGGGGGAGATAGNGGNGGYFGGGGGADTGTGGNGGDFGGGGGSDDSSGGNGGFGGGGGGGAGTNTVNNEVGGNGGFGGGGGAGVDLGGTGGFGAGNGGFTGGGGGAGFGGAVFVRDGGTLTVLSTTGSSVITGSTVTAGTGAGDGANGTAAGSAFYLHNVGVTFTPAMGNSITFNANNNIEDATGNGQAGSLTMNGFGSLILNGTNTYTGPTSVTNGLLQIGATGSLISDTTIDSGEFEILAGGSTDGTVTLNNGLFDLFGTANGIITQNGGVFNIQGTGMATADITVNGGLMEMFMGGTATANTLINANGTLAGVGSLNNLTVNGTITPGASGTNNFGTFTITGNYVQNAGSTYNVDVAPGMIDLIDVTGTATINGGDLVVTDQGGAYAFQEVLTLVDATGGVTGVYDTFTVIGNTIFALQYTPTQVNLVASSNIVGTVPGLTFNQMQIGQNIDNNAALAGADFSGVITELLALGPAGIPEGLDQLGGEIFGSLGNTAILNMNSHLDAVADRLRPVPSSSDAPCIQVPPERLPPLTMQTGWINVFGTSGTFDTDGNADGMDYDMTGTAFGVDYRVHERIVVGISGGFLNSQSTIDSGLQSGEIESYQIGMYTGYTGSNYHLLFAASYGFSQYEASRNINFLMAPRTAVSSYDGNDFGCYFEAGGLIPLGPCFFVKPIVGLRYATAHTDSFTETGANSINLMVADDSDESFRTILGARVGRPFTAGNLIVFPQVHAMWESELKGDDRFVGAQFTEFTGIAPLPILGNPMGENFGRFGGSVLVNVTPRISLMGTYDMTRTNYFDSHRVNAGVEAIW